MSKKKYDEMSHEERLEFHLGKIQKSTTSISTTVGFFFVLWLIGKIFAFLVSLGL